MYKRQVLQLAGLAANALIADIPFVGGIVFVLHAGWIFSELGAFAFIVSALLDLEICTLNLASNSLLPIMGVAAAIGYVPVAFFAAKYAGVFNKKS